MPPLVSVVLPVYNVASYIESTVASVLAQTFENFELLVLDDCSTDNTVALIEQITDPRVRLIQNERNLGRAGTDNAALPHVRGEFIAKMDGDDVCHPERLARQVAFLQAHPEVDVVGGWMQNFGASNYLNRYPERPDDARVFTLFGLPVGNPTVMLRTRLLRHDGMHYNAALRQTEDYDFFARYAERLRVATLPEALINYRTFPDKQKTVLGERTEVADLVREQLLTRWEIGYSPRELHVHNTIAMLHRPLGDVTLGEVQQWLLRLLQHNETQPWFEPAALRRGLAQRWFEVCYTHPQPWLGAIRAYRRNPLAEAWPLSAGQYLRFAVKGLRSSRS
ncbi:glycosyltransferase family 2 protein [Hymenobacter busanensis]|uniref:Glycosyltransferase family 2 protein n=1 Tax=Hymenobacter busanensis TaxID=2607656 RepID=A0A7L4ZVZ2_9BACT|nr:glycosyltransferase family A protein [Hymenobacter busanensis]KAA9332272.1 glycosyltransferase family 2 protein [Hymenobacter busanensis]QHJ07391.1 glycosyltransferase [Hymenobacter busanensis]